jgi:hypothetical protein
VRVRRSSTLLTRLALAALAISGFVAPLATAEVDRVAQTVGGRVMEPRRHEQAPATVAAREDLRPPMSTARAVRPVEPGAEGCRRYLLHRAWLI